MQDLRVSLIQTNLVWQDAQANMNHIRQLLEPLVGKTDLIVLPEMFNSGFSMQPELIAETVDGETVQWLRKQAERTGAAICGSIAVRLAQGFANRMLFVTPDGTVQHYDKRHLFRMGDEHQHYVEGKERRIVEYRGWRILLQVCYDLRFPVWSRNCNDYDLVAYVANWPGSRRGPWRTLLQARALENQCYCVGVNRIGEDGNGLAYTGDSLLVDYLGELKIDSAPETAFVTTATLAAEPLLAFREKFPAWRDRDHFQLEL
ncbi:MAG: amidohydrolase [Neptuniibacter caesariensis]|uniref:Omega-amidase YafV n=1 Tax=Neptuniibacter caesariensis TaxID=207954 RepID=A0A2G6JAC8_NEPCE|nr:MAG: amidohydrolase [Neptuniibacter caesariensis]